MRSSPLFRAHALAHATVRQYGSIVLLRPASLTWLTALFCLLGLGIVLFFALASYTHREQVSGVLMPTQGLVSVQSAQAGRVLDVKVREQQTVRAGDALFVLADDAVDLPARPAGGAARTRVVRAPQDGVVGGVAIQPGQAVAAGQLLTQLTPAGALLEAELDVPSRAIGFARVGMPVLIRYQAYPFQKFGQFQGTVSDISRTPLGGAEPRGAGRAVEPFYRVRVQLARQNAALNGQERPLMAGMVLDASLQLETRKLYEWVLEPLYSGDGKA